MKISSIKAYTNKLITNIERRNEQKYLDRYVRLHCDSMNEDTAKELLNCRTTLANYLSKKGVSVDIYDAGHEMDELTDSVLERLLENKISIRAQDMLTEKSGICLMGADTKATYPHIENDYFQIDNLAEGIQYPRITTHEYEDNFLRALYRNVSEMVEDIRGKNK